MIQRIQSSNERVVEEHTKSLVIMKLQESEEQQRYGRLIGESASMRALLERLNRLSNEQKHLIIIGEAGTGKVNVARELHYRTTSGQYPLLTLNVNDMSLHDWETNAKAAKGGTIIVEGAEGCPADKMKQMLHASANTRVVLTSTRPLDVTNTEVLQVPAARAGRGYPIACKLFYRKRRGSR